MAGGGRHNAVVEARASTLEELARSRNEEQVLLRWAWRKRCCVAAAMVLENAGRTGTLFHCPADGPDVDADVLVDLIRSISGTAICGGLSLVHASLQPTAKANIAVLRSAGYELLAELVHMKLALTGPIEEQADADLSWRSYDQFTEDELSEVIASTYEGSLDCPDLSGVRKISDIIAGHKASGAFRPGCWWIVCCDGAPAGCILVNDLPASSSAEVVYMGVAAACRGRGLAQKMLSRAAGEALSRGLDEITLAVDVRNHYATNIYTSMGFKETHKRQAWIATKRTHV